MSHGRTGSGSRWLFLALMAGGALVFAVTFMIVQANPAALDDTVADWVANSRSDILGHWGVAVAAVTRPLVVTVIVVGVGIALMWRGRIRDAVVLVLATLAADGLAVFVKEWTQRPRPEAPIALLTQAEPSFPSGHVLTVTTASFVLVLVLWPYLSARARRWSLAAAAATFTLIVAVDRLLVGAHWLTDVIAALAASAVLIGVSGLALSWHRGAKHRGDHSETRTTTFIAAGS